MDSSDGVSISRSVRAFCLKKFKSTKEVEMNRNLLQTLTWILIVVILCMGVFATALWVGKNILLPIYDRYQAAVQAQQVAPTQTLWVLVVTATPFQPELTTTPQVENPVMVISTPGDWVPYESEGGV